MTVIVQQPTDSNGNPQPMVYDSDTGKVIVDSNGYVLNGGQRLVNVPTKTEYLSTLKTQTAGIQEALNYAAAEDGFYKEVRLLKGSFKSQTDIYIPSGIYLTSGPFAFSNNYSQSQIYADGSTIYIGTSSAVVTAVVIENILFELTTVRTNCGQTIIRNCGFNFTQLYIDNTTYQSSNNALNPFIVDSCTFEGGPSSGSLYINTANGTYTNLYFVESGTTAIYTSPGGGNITFKNILILSPDYGIVSNAGGNTFINVYVISPTVAGIYLAAGNGSFISNYQTTSSGVPSVLVETNWNYIDMGIFDLGNSGTAVQIGSSSVNVSNNTFKIFLQDAGTAAVTVFDIVGANGPLYFEGTVADINSNITLFSGTVPTGSNINMYGYVPTPSTPSVPTSATAQENTNPYAVDVYIYGGDVTEIQITRNGTAYTVLSVSTAIAMSGQSYKLNPGDSITVTYTTAPDWEWLSD